MTTGVLARRWPTLLLLATCSGLAASVAIDVGRSTTVALLVLAGVVALVAAPGPWRVIGLASALAVAGLAWGSIRLDALDHSVLAPRIGDSASARVVVTTAARPFGDSLRMFADVRRFGADQMHESVLLVVPRGRAPPRGAVLEVVRAWPLEPRGPETGFDERAWLERRGVHVVLRATEPRVVGRRGGIGGVADRLRAHVQHSLARGARGERLALLRGIVLGDDAGLSPPLRDAFRGSGLAHLTAVSGQNVAIVALGLAWLGWLLGIGRLGAQVVAVGGIVAYALAVGWEPSVARATVAGCVACVAVLASRRSDGWHALGLGALVLLAWRPTTVLDPGFQLSFVAVAAILVTVPRVTRWVEGYTRLARPVVLTAVAAACGVATAPIVWLHFGYVALWTVPANVAAEPAMPLVLGLGLAGALLEPVLPWATTTLSWAAGEASAWIAGCARLFGGLPHAEMHSPAAIGVAVATLAGVAGAARLPRYRRAQAALAAGVLAAAGLGLAAVTASAPPRWVPPEGLRVTVLDVGQGDAILLEVERGAVLVDQGPPEADVAGALRRRGIRSLSAIVLTHPQRDHIGGAERILRSLTVDRVLDPGLSAPSVDHRRALAAARARGTGVVVVRSGDVLRLGRLVLRVLWPAGPDHPGEDPNEHAVVLLATFGKLDVLLTADAESNVLSRLRLRAVDVLKVAHHGSEDEGLPALLRVLRPAVAVISVGRRNDYGHPRAETLDALERVPGLRLLRTDLDGEVVIESNGATMTVRTER